MKGWILLVGAGTFATGIFMSGCAGTLSSSTASKEDLGKALFFDTSLSSPGGQSCGTCHDPGSFFTDPRGTVTAQGVLPGVFGKRQVPTAMYMSFSPKFGFSAEEGDYIGGQFWDGRAATLEEQAKGPFLNPAEMHNGSKQEVIDKIRTGPLAEQFRKVYGSDVFSDTEKAYDDLADAIAAFERTDVFHPFSSKYDQYLKGKVQLTDAEMRGLHVFEEPNKGNCAACHPNRPGPHGEPPLFTDFSYDNIGLPKNTNNPFYSQPSWNNPDGNSFVDLGLSDTTSRPGDHGRFKVPTLRNVAMTGPYFHDGVFTTLEDVVRFYNQRDLGGFGPPECDEGVNDEELGDLHLTAQEQTDLVAFLKTLTDGYQP
ncbi:MAG: cytochrome-c peroxidase [Armatimonadetes bacterium]|nr:cytochrome-c peroxidase [Armatimonadota bacterium]